MNANARQKILQPALYILALTGAAAVVYALLFSALPGGLSRTVEAQQDPFLNQRIGQIEQRLNTMESRINRVELDARLPVRPAPPAGDNSEIELRLLRSEIETLRLRLAQAECGIVKLDERTLTNAARQERKKPAAGENDPCRLNPNAPVQIIARP